MENVNVSISTLDTLIEGLESAINVCYNVDSNDSNSEKTYPYAVGYSSATMREVIDQLKTLNVRGY